MKIVVRHEGASEQEVEQTCVWVVGEDGETVSTEYLKPGEQVDLNVSGEATIDAEFGTVGPVAAPAEEEPVAEDPPAPSGDQSSASTSGDGGTSGGGDDSAGAPGVQSGGQAGGAIAE